MPGSQSVDRILRNRCKVVCVDPNTTMAQAAHRMRICNISSLVVTNEQGLVVGIVTERDVVELVVLKKDPATATVAQSMSQRMVTCSPQTTIPEALRLMTKHGIRHLPVVHEGKPIGMVSSRDILAYELEKTREVVQSQSLVLRELESSYPGITRVQLSAGGRVVI
jgi:CBS domain-containing protein